MARKVVRDWRTWAVTVGIVVVFGVFVPLVVLGSGQEEFTATPYADVIRFEARGVASLQVQIFDLSGRKLWDSGVVLGQVVDWNRTNDWGERLAYGTYAYQAQGWNAQGALVLQKSGKLVLLPGDKVQLQQAPALFESPAAVGPETLPSLQPMATFNEDVIVNAGYSFINLVPNNGYDSFSIRSGATLLGNLLAYGPGFPAKYFGFVSYRPDYDIRFYSASTSIATGIHFYTKDSGGTDQIRFSIRGGDTAVAYFDRVTLGIGTISPAGKVDIRNTADQPALRIEASAGTNLIEAYNTGSGSATGLVFRVERETGNVRADGAFYGAGFYSGSADVAEYVNVSEPVEPGDVVEIDPANPGHFRKARTAGSHLVAGVISTQPGVVLGSNSDPVEGEEDPRPVLALAGRVPVKATTENGPIQVGDLLIASSKPGYAMRATDPISAVGAIIGKALEPLEEGEGFIMIQVTLR